MNKHKVWFITGASSGFGRILAQSVLSRGDCAVLTARRLAPLEEIAGEYGARALCLSLDVTDAVARKKALQAAIDQFGRIDVLANIAGAGSYGALEEFSSEQIRAQMELNFFAPAELSREVLPLMRAQQSGHILNLTSIAGMVAFPGSGLYCASKFALEGFTEALHHEVKPLGIRVTLIEPGAFRTGFAGSALTKAANEIPAYVSLTGGMSEYFTTQDGRQMGDPEKGVRVIIDAVESETPPVRLLLGEDAYEMWDAVVESRDRDFAPWRELGMSTSFADAVKNTAQVL